MRPLTKQQICTIKWGLDRRHVTEAMKRQVFADYGVPLTDRKLYEVDHLIPRELGGADDVRNLWPQPWIGEHNAHEKDRFENQMHKLVCSGEVSLPAAQDAFRHWVSARDKYAR